MEKERMGDNDRAGMTDMPIIPGFVDMQSQHTNTDIYPEEDELDNALCLVCLMINKNRIRT